MLKTIITNNAAEGIVEIETLRVPNFDVAFKQELSCDVEILNR